MTTTRNNHYVPEWYQKGFMDEQKNQLIHLKRKVVELAVGRSKIIDSKKWYAPTQCFYQKDLYSTFFGTEVSDEIERKLFGPIDDNGATAVRAFQTDEQAQWHHNFENFFLYLDAQKIRTPKGLDWVKSKYSTLSQLQLMKEMQALRSIHCTHWGEAIREFVSAENSDVKFIVSDHPVTIYNYACPPDSDLCRYPNDPDITLKGSQTIFPLNKNRCLILTNLEYAQNPEIVNPLEQRTNSMRIRHSLVNTIEFINHRKLDSNDVIKINHIIKSRSNNSIAAGKEEWLHPENVVNCDWSDLRNTLLPPASELHRYGGEMYAQFEDGSVHYQDAFGRKNTQHKFLNKDTEETKIGRNGPCGCGSGRKYKKCCLSIAKNLRTTWDVASIRERNLAFCNGIREILGLNKGKTWLDVRRELSNQQITDIYGFYSVLWPSDTDIYSLLPKSDKRHRGLYTGPLDVRTIGKYALPFASLFDEFLIENPIPNPNNLRSEFSPIQSPEKYKYQALKDFLFMLALEPYIRCGLVNLIQNPNSFDLHLMRAMMNLASNRNSKIVSKKDEKLFLGLFTEDLLNSMYMMPQATKKQVLMQEFNLSEESALRSIDLLEQNAEASSLTMLQPSDSGQFIQFSMGPNYELSLFVAQITGSILVTDCESRLLELQSAQHKVHGVITHPWANVLERVNVLPLDYKMVDTFKKSQQEFSTARSIMQSIDRLILNNDRETAKLSHLAEQASNAIAQFKHNDNADLAISEVKILSPEGGFYDTNVQRLLAQSNCSIYDLHVRSVYSIGPH